MFMNFMINSYLKNISVEKAILVAKQFSIEFDEFEMTAILPYIKCNWQGFLDENKKTYLLNELSNKTSLQTAKKTDMLINKLLIILS